MAERIFVRPHRRYRIEFVVDFSAGTFDLRINGCVRKSRPIRADGASYVWTNIELEWEEHRLLEGWLEPSADGYALRATENGEPIIGELLVL